ncbi:hypothetical protein N7501_001088 [Penicillium viridicatum]|nr:hypothetical protein N7501_001088 [Penicillium viridicatum]
MTGNPNPIPALGDNTRATTKADTKPILALGDNTHPILTREGPLQDCPHPDDQLEKRHFTTVDSCRRAPPRRRPFRRTWSLGQ